MTNIYKLAWKLTTSENFFIGNSSNVFAKNLRAKITQFHNEKVAEEKEKIFHSIETDLDVLRKSKIADTFYIDYFDKAKNKAGYENAIKTVESDRKAMNIELKTESMKSRIETAVLRSNFNYAALKQEAIAKRKQLLDKK